MTDGDLVRQTLAGRTEAYAELVRRWASRIMAVCHAKVRRGSAAEDLAQESLLRGFRALNTLADPDRFGGWLVGIATRVCLDWLKARERTTVPFSSLGVNHQPDHLPSRNHDGAWTAEQADESRRVIAEIEELPDDYREVILLYYYQDVTYQDLAKLLNVSSATINARLTKARAMLRQRLSPLRREQHGV